MSLNLKQWGKKHLNNKQIVLFHYRIILDNYGSVGCVCVFVCVFGSGGVGRVIKGKPSIFTKDTNFH